MSAKRVKLRVLIPFIHKGKQYKPGDVLEIEPAIAKVWFGSLQPGVEKYTASEKKQGKGGVASPLPSSSKDGDVYEKKEKTTNPRKKKTTRTRNKIKTPVPRRNTRST